MSLWLPSTAPGVRLVRLERKLVCVYKRQRVGSALSGGLDAALAAPVSLISYAIHGGPPTASTSREAATPREQLGG